MSIDDRQDDGLTAVELIIYILVSALFLGLLATMLAQGWNANAQTTSRDSATGRATIVSESVARSVRNALDVDVQDEGLTLVARVATGAGGWACRSWTLSGDTILYRSDTSGWGPLASGVVGQLAGGAIFTATGTRAVTMSFDVNSDGEVVRVRTEATAQAVTNEPVEPECW